MKGILFQSSFVYTPEGRGDMSTTCRQEPTAIHGLIGDISCFKEDCGDLNETFSNIQLCKVFILNEKHS